MIPTRESLARARNLRKAAKVSLALIALLLLAGTVLATNGYDIPRHVMGAGGARAEAPPYALHGTLGQAVVGESGGGPYELNAGYWFSWEWEPSHWAYLPLIMRDTK